VQTLFEQVPTVPVSPPVQSLLAQQAGAVVETHRAVPPQFRNPVLHLIAQAEPSQVDMPFASGAGQAAQRVPQEATLLLGRHVPLQL
jgi:hypothetical protein